MGGTLEGITRFVSCFFDLVTKFIALSLEDIDLLLQLNGTKLGLSLDK